MVFFDIRKLCLFDPIVVRLGISLGPVYGAWSQMSGFYLGFKTEYKAGKIFSSQRCPQFLTRLKRVILYFGFTYIFT